MNTTSTSYRPTVRPALATGILLLVPWVAMQCTGEVAWSWGDFLAAGTLLTGTGLLYEFVARKVRSAAGRVAFGVALAAALLLVWVNLAVGLIGDENNPANWMYAGVLAVGLLGAARARLHPRGMARAALATAGAQALVALIALIAGAQRAPGSSVGEILGANAVFAALFAVSAGLFQRAARESTGARAGR